MKLAIPFTAQSEPKIKPSRATGICILPATLCEGGKVLTDEQLYQWRQRLIRERDLKNLTDLHVRILLFSQGAIEAGEDEMSHATVAEAQKVSVRTVGDAYRRARVLGMLEWDPQYRAVHGVRRRTVNRYRLVLPAGEPVERHRELRRQRRKPILYSLPSCSVDVAEPAFRAAQDRRLLAKFDEERRLRAQQSAWCREQCRRRQ